MLQLRRKPFTFQRVFHGKKAQAFQKLIINSQPFEFNMEDIERLRNDIRTLIENLSNIYVQWKKDTQGEEDSVASPGNAEVVISMKKNFVGRGIGEKLKTALDPAIIDGANCTEIVDARGEQKGERMPSSSGTDADNRGLSDKDGQRETSAGSTNALAKSGESEEGDGGEPPQPRTSTAVAADVSKDEDDNSCDQPQPDDPGANELEKGITHEGGLQRKESSSSEAALCTGEEKENTLNEATGSDGLCHHRPTVDTANREAAGKPENPRTQIVPESPPNQTTAQHQIAEDIEI